MWKSSRFLLTEQQRTAADPLKYHRLKNGPALSQYSTDATLFVYVTDGFLEREDLP